MASAHTFVIQETFWIINVLSIHTNTVSISFLQLYAFRNFRHLSQNNVLLNDSDLHRIDSGLLHIYIYIYIYIYIKNKVKGLPQQAEVAQGVPRRLRPRIFLTFGTTRVVGRQPYPPAAFTSGEFPGTNF